jgi:hypothetical protein
MKNVMMNVFGGAVAAAALFVAFDFALTGSDVYVSYSTNECVKVENFDGILFSAGNYSCENLPEKFNHVWAK